MAKTWQGAHTLARLRILRILYIKGVAVRGPSGSIKTGQCLRQVDLRPSPATSANQAREGEKPLMMMVDLLIS